MPLASTVTIMTRMTPVGIVISLVIPLLARTKSETALGRVGGTADELSGR